MNKTGKGGFGEHPENISKVKPGRPKKGETWRDYFNFYLDCKARDLKEFANNKTLPIKAQIVINTIINAIEDGVNVRAIEMIMNRTDGAPKQPVEHTVTDYTIEFPECMKDENNS